MVKFVGKDSYVPPENEEEMHILAIKTIREIEKIFNNFKSYASDNSIFNDRWFNISINKEEAAFLRVNIGFRDDIIEYKYPDKIKPIFDFMKKISDGVLTIINNIDRNNKNVPNLFYDISFSPDWAYYYSMKIRPWRGIYWCPLCDYGKEDSEENHIGFYSEKLIACSSGHERVYFIDSILKNEYENGKIIFKENNRSIKLIMPNDLVGYRIYEELYLYANEETVSFRKRHIDEFNQGFDRIYLILEKEIPVGYIIWNTKNSNKVLRQIFILEKYRRMGLATLLTKISVDEEVGDALFGIESPNKISMAILLKLGLAKLKDGQIVGVQCFRVQGL